MSDLREYKCPACGGAMEFDSGSQKMKCPFCDTEVSIEEFEQEQKKNPEETRWEAGNGAKWKEDEISGLAVYSCQSCGGEITAEKTTGATTCPFCGNRVVLKGQFEGELLVIQCPVSGQSLGTADRGGTCCSIGILKDYFLCFFNFCAFLVCINRCHRQRTIIICDRYGNGIFLF